MKITNEELESLRLQYEADRRKKKTYRLTDQGWINTSTSMPKEIKDAIIKGTREEIVREEHQD